MATQSQSKRYPGTDADMPADGQADGIGLAVARAAQAAAPEATVILFGSRARGDHRAGSDVDLLVIADDRPTLLGVKGDVSKAAYRKLKEVGGRFGVDVIGLTRERFNYCRRARNHIAAQAIRDGVIMNEECFDDWLPDDDGYPDDWPDTRQRIRNARRWQGSMNHSIATGLDDQELIGFIAQQGVENALKGWISAIDCEYHNIHSIDRLADILMDNVPEHSSAARDALDGLMAYITFPPEQLARRRPYESRDWLTEYAVTYRYGGAEHRLDAAGYRELAAQINRAIDAVVEQIYLITGTGPADLDDGG